MDHLYNSMNSLLSRLSQLFEGNWRQWKRVKTQRKADGALLHSFVGIPMFWVSQLSRAALNFVSSKWVFSLAVHSVRTPPRRSGQSDSIYWDIKHIKHGFLIFRQEMPRGFCKKIHSFLPIGSLPLHNSCQLQLFKRSCFDSRQNVAASFWASFART